MPLSIGDVKARILADNEASPQRRGLAEIHLDELERALAGLAALGANVTLDLGGSPSAVQYPKMLFHARELNHKIVESSDEEKAARSAGWNEYPGGVPPAAAVRMPGAMPPPAPPPTSRVTIGGPAGSAMSKGT